MSGQDRPGAPVPWGEMVALAVAAVGIIAAVFAIAMMVSA